MFGATIPTITWSGALLSFVGVAMMEYGGSPNVVVVALSSAIWFILQKFFLDKSGSNLRLCTWSVLWEWIISFPWIPALYTGVFSTGLCLVAEMDAMRDVSATETAIIYGLEPVWGAAFAWFLLGERWDFSEWIGAALVLCGSLLVQTEVMMEFWTPGVITR
ncbi:hypothetical protein HPP92_027104 [Vanilla planifolia]|uniref:EamA domain-containing protein n=1 Tax=Vanilla planifolia TaxID=51239 RepID=A0A835PDZ1_VANPL|nr:hypothetical protein HPP92_027104 [Vanilla planifolia]KAG0449748.1 hypothetical protein HPP92_027195 [Vanilla planifolia]